MALFALERQPACSVPPNRVPGVVQSVRAHMVWTAVSGYAGVPFGPGLHPLLWAARHSISDWSRRDSRFSRRRMLSLTRL